MLTLIFILLITFASLVVILWAGTFFFQGYIYTEPSAGIYWQAPAAAFFLTVGYTIWLMTVAFTPTASKINIPINVFHKFTPNEDLLDRPPAITWAIKAARKSPDGKEKEPERVEYMRKGGLGSLQTTKYTYVEKNADDKRWSSKDIVAIEIIYSPDPSKPEEVSKMRFDASPSDVADYNLFVGPDGWTIRDWTKDGPDFVPKRFRFLRLVANVAFNVAHLVAWFLALWLLLRFQWSHALGFAFVMWLGVTLAILPMMLFEAADVAEKRQVRTAQLAPGDVLASRAP